MSGPPAPSSTVSWAAPPRYGYSSTPQSEPDARRSAADLIRHAVKDPRRARRLA